MWASSDRVHFFLSFLSLNVNIPIENAGVLKDVGGCEGQGNKAEFDWSFQRMRRD